jgi:hypothetical protein
MNEGDVTRPSIGVPRAAVILISGLTTAGFQTGGLFVRLERDGVPSRPMVAPEMPKMSARHAIAGGDDGPS